MTNAPVTLPLAIARCPATRTKSCAQSDTCARALVDGKGREVNDYSVNSRSANGACLSYMDAGQHRKAVDGPAHRVHEAPQGIFRG
jgi:hypothetical protein